MKKEKNSRYETQEKRRINLWEVNLNEFFNITILVCGDFCVKKEGQLKISRAKGYLILS
jgi:hypothetical protein